MCEMPEDATDVAPGSASGGSSGAAATDPDVRQQRHQLDLRPPVHASAGNSGCPSPPREPRNVGIDLSRVLHWMGSPRRSAILRFRLNVGGLRQCSGSLASHQAKSFHLWRCCPLVVRAAQARELRPHVWQPSSLRSRPRYSANVFMAVASEPLILARQPAAERPLGSDGLEARAGGPRPVAGHTTDGGSMAPIGRALGPWGGGAGSQVLGAPRRRLLGLGGGGGTDRNAAPLE